MSSVLDHQDHHELASGITIDELVRPGTSGELGGMLKECTAASRTVLPFGGGGSLCTGRVVPRFDVGVDTRSLSGVIEYQPADLTLSVRAGTTMAEIAEVLAEKGQELPVDVPFPDQTTIGGLAATGFAGPRKLLFGSLKDAIIGCEYVRGDGLIAKAGGMVVKNVSGFEIPRFLHGSWGSLAVLTSINLKVAPRPRSEATVHTEWADVAAAIEGHHHLAGQVPSLAAAVVTVSGGKGSTSCRVMGRAEAVAATSALITSLLPGESTTTGTEDSRAFWQGYVDAWVPPANGAQVAIGAPPRDVAQVVAAAIRALGDDAGSSSLAIAPGLGSIRIRTSPERSEMPFWPLSRLSGMPDNVIGILEAGPDSIRTTTDPWGPRPQGHVLMQAIKQQFDPANILNRGRLFI